MVWVEGQLLEANVRNGHAYLTLRDVDSDFSFSVTIWSSTMRKLDATPEVGSRVVAQVKPSFYAKTGRLSLNATDLRPVGLGELLVRLERLRQALGAEGLFAPEHKLPLPVLPGRIGLITGRDSDAEKDVLRNATLRWPSAQFRVINTAVQGVDSANQVTSALKELDADPQIDVIVIARGGGALKTSLPFSNEELIRAVFGYARLRSSRPLATRQTGQSLTMSRMCVPQLPRMRPSVLFRILMKNSPDCSWRVIVLSAQSTTCWNAKHNFSPPYVSVRCLPTRR